MKRATTTTTAATAAGNRLAPSRCLTGAPPGKRDRLGSGGATAFRFGTPHARASAHRARPVCPRDSPGQPRASARLPTPLRSPPCALSLSYRSATWKRRSASFARSSGVQIWYAARPCERAPGAPDLPARLARLCAPQARRSERSERPCAVGGRTRVARRVGLCACCARAHMHILRSPSHRTWGVHRTEGSRKARRDWCRRCRARSNLALCLRGGVGTFPVYDESGGWCVGRAQRAGLQILRHIPSQ